MLNSIKLTNLLSFGAETEIVLNPGLNVLIGANGSGKSNLIEVISLLQSLPKDLTKVIRDGGGIEEWLWKGEKVSIAKIEIEVSDFDNSIIRHVLEFQSIYFHTEIINEEIWRGENRADGVIYEPEFILVSVDDEIVNQSILSQIKDPYNPDYRVLTYLGNSYQRIRLYREWQFGRHTPPRVPQRADLPNDFLEEDASNLGLILNSFRRNPEVKKKLLESLKLFYENVEDFDVIVQGGYVQVFFEENGFTIPATRLSDGTLRYLSLLAILLHPNPPPLICIEEPELGLHPDVLPTLIDLLKEAAQKTQVIITTHSADLIDDLSDMPESVLVFDKYQGSTSVSRLDKDELKDWLDDYRLGEMWRRGHFGGNRW
jgi:predicted ATPase